MITKEYVISLLENYNSKKRQIELLRFEQMNGLNISEEDVIESLALGSSLTGGGSTRGHISDKTMMIAMKYREIGDEMMEQAQIQVSQELRSLEREIGRLDHYLSLINEEKQTVIRKFYIENNTIMAIAASMNISKGTVISRRNNGMEELVSMYQYWSDVQNNP